MTEAKQTARTTRVGRWLADKSIVSNRWLLWDRLFFYTLGIVVGALFAVGWYWHG